MPDSADWERLSLRLQAQRVMLNSRYRNRALFARERGINYRLAQDVETLYRDNFDYPTKISIDLAYGWEPGSVDRVLAGGEPVVAPRPRAADVLSPREQVIGDALPESFRRAGDDGRETGNGGR